MKRACWTESLALVIVLVLIGCPEETDSNYSYADIQRTYETQEEAALITLAEQACPPREDVLAVAAPDDRASLAAEAGQDCLWWCAYDDSQNAFRLPYAVTTGAIDYFSASVEQHLQTGAAAPDAYLHYLATITLENHFEVGEKQYDNIYLVEMTLQYEEWLHMEARAVSKQRTVLISAEGEVLATFGDGASEAFTLRPVV